MSSLKCIQDIFGQDPTGSSTIVVQGLSDRVQADSLQYYLEVITKQTVQAVRVEFENGGVALAVFEEQVSDECIRLWQERAGNRKFEGKVPTFKLLGKPEGIYLELTKDTTISEEYLTLYFENKKSGGMEESVTDAKLSESALKVHAVVRISSAEAIKSIVRKRDHTFKGVDVALQPYYSKIHDNMIRAARKECQPYESPTIQIPKFEDSTRVATVMPMQRNMVKQYSIDSRDADEQHNKPKGRSRDRYYTNVEEKEKTAEVPLTAVQIEMLEICNFQDMYQTDSLQFVLNEKAGKVFIKSLTDEEARQGKLQIYECLNSIQMKQEKLTESRLMLLKRKKSKIYLRSICNQEKVRASFVVREATKTIEWYGFTDADIERGMKVLQNEISVQEITLKQGQERTINGREWNNLTKKIGIGTTCIYVDENSKTIIIESFSDKKAREIKNHIINFLKEDVLTKTDLVTLECAKARCFRTHFAGKLKQEAEKRNGKFEIKEVNQCPLKLEILVEGEEALTDELHKCVDQIWHERIDFDKISSAEEDKWLMLRGLGGEAGSDFVRNFEDQHKCFIDVSKKGSFFVPKPSSDDDDSTGNFGSDENLKDKGASSRESDMPEHKWAGKRFKRDKKRLLQGATNEDEAFKQALANSLQDQNTNEDRRLLQTPSSTNTQEFTEDTKETHLLATPNTTSIKINHINVSLMRGKIVKQEADVLVNVVSPTGSITDGVISKSILQTGGDSLKQMYQDAFDKAGGPATVVSTGASGGLRCRAVLHVTLQPGAENCNQILGKVLPEMLDKCHDNGYSTLALPPLGVGRMYKYPAKDVAKQILQGISRYQKGRSGNTLKKITIVIFKDDDKTFQEFDDAFTSFTTVPRKRKTKSSAGDRHSYHSSRPTGHDRSDSYTRHTHGSADRVSGRKDKSADRVSGMKDLKSTSSENKRNRKSRFHDDQLLEDLKVEVIADSKDKCVKARNQLEKEIKKEFLYEEKIPKPLTISGELNWTIIEIVGKHNIKLIKDKDEYILKGFKENVKAASQKISQILLEEKGNFETRRKKREDVKRGTKDFAELMYEKEPVVPAYWDIHKPQTSLKELLLSFKDFVTGKKHKKVSLPQDSRPYAAIIKMINGTFDQSKVGQGSDAVGLDKFHYSKLFVVKIERIENLELYEKFARQIQIFYRRLSLAGEGRYPKISKLPDCHGAVKTKSFVRSALDENTHPDLNEVFLFHGTKKENVEVICDSGLDHRLAGDKAMFGQGIYGAECSLKADQYADDKTKRTAGQGEVKKMFLVRMLLGNAFVCKDPNPHKYRRPPCTKCFKDDCITTKHANKFGHLFDSIIGDNGKLFREFVVYDSNNCYPEYLITYERR